MSKNSRNNTIILHKNSVEKEDNKRYTSRKREYLNIKRRLSIYLSKVWIFVKIFIIFCALLLTIVYSADIQKFITQKFYGVSSAVGFVVKNIHIQGRQNASLDEILSISGVIKNTPIFSVDIQEIKFHLENYSWIKEVLVTRKLPDTIQIYIVEKIPIAVWQKNQQLSLIDADGNIIAVNELSKFNNLLHVVGDDANTYADNLIQMIPQDLLPHILSAIRFGNRRWNLLIKSGITIKMPENGFDKAIAYLLNLQKTDGLFNSNIKMLDLRNHNKYYIEYK